jgi:uncharacterized C2H2 Zn-finger protein
MIQTVRSELTADNDYGVIHGGRDTVGKSLGCFTEFWARAMDSDTTRGRAVRDIRCPKCGDVFSSVEILRIHTCDSDLGESILDDPDVYHWRCAYCPAVADTQAELQTHVNSLHQWELSMFRCDTCGFLTKDLKYLRRHRRSVHNNRGDSEFPQSGGDSKGEDHSPLPQLINAVSSASGYLGPPQREVVTLRVRDFRFQWMGCP